MIGAANVSEAYSVGNESNRRTQGKLKNQIGIIRKSYEFAGNVGNRTVEYLLPTKTDLLLNYGSLLKSMSMK
jgi:hypothetical protein